MQSNKSAKICDAIHVPLLYLWTVNWIHFIGICFILCVWDCMHFKYIEDWCSKFRHAELDKWTEWKWLEIYSPWKCYVIQWNCSNYHRTSSVMWWIIAMMQCRKLQRTDIIADRMRAMRVFRNESITNSNWHGMRIKCCQLIARQSTSAPLCALVSFNSSELIDSWFECMNEIFFS